MKLMKESMEEDKAFAMLAEDRLGEVRDKLTHEEMWNGV